jgi:hypothetical protein
MHVCDLTYKEVKTRYPAEVAKIMSALKKGKSKNREAKPQDLKWSFETCVEVEGYSFADILAGKAAEKAAKLRDMSLEDRVSDTLRRTHTSLTASIGRWGASERVPNPPEVEANVREGLVKQQREQDAFNALSPEEQERDRSETLNAFFKGGGMVVVVPKAH